jgi:hypothetical protein
VIDAGNVSSQPQRVKDRLDEQNGRRNRNKKYLAERQAGQYVDVVSIIAFREKSSSG